MSSDTPILPAHIDDTIQAIAKLHADHYQQSSRLQRVVDQMTALLGRPGFVGCLTLAVLVWVLANLGANWLGREPMDPPPFVWLQGAISLMALYMTALILTTQRREDQLAGHREQLTLELAILSEQKSARSLRCWCRCVETIQASQTASITKLRICRRRQTLRRCSTRSKRAATALNQQTLMPCGLPLNGLR